MQGHRRRRETQRSPATSISPKGGGGTASISLSLLLHDVTDIASSLLRELDAVARSPQTSWYSWDETLRARRLNEDQSEPWPLEGVDIWTNFSEAGYLPSLPCANISA